MIKKRGEKSPSFFVRLIVLSFARSVSLHLALLSFVSPRSPGESKYPTHLFILVACQSQAWSSVSKPNTRNTTFDFKIGTQEMIKPQKREKTLGKN
jgi:hypothetical protein